MSQSYYLISSFKSNPEFLFDGYCFMEEDFILGEGGAREYIKSTGNSIVGGEDGCYVVGYKKNGDYFISNDYGGYKKILYYYDPLSKAWAVSNSIVAIIQHLRDYGIRISLDYALLNFHAKAKGVASQQPISYETIAKGIQLLPTCTTLKVNENGVEIQPNNRSLQNKDYNDIFHQFTSVWVSRLQTLFSNSNLSINQALTGGIDSRSIFALSSVAKNELKNERQQAAHSYNCGKIRGDSKDLEVATNITDYYGYPLNLKSSKVKQKYLSGSDTYDRWKYLCLGLYYPTYFDPRSLNPFLIQVSGGGGEKYRPYYRLNSDDSFDKFCRRNLKQLQNKPYEYELNVSMKNSMRYLRLKRDGDPLQLHYTEFRNRLHSGLFPQFIVDVSPLNSRLFADIPSNFPEKILSSQILYDLISLERDALSFEFDDHKKAPKQYNIEKLIYLDKSQLSYKIGHMYIDKDIIINNDNLDSSYDKSHLNYLENDITKALSNDKVLSLWDSDFLKRVEKTVDDLLLNKRLPHAIEGIPISCLLASSIFYQ